MRRGMRAAAAVLSSLVLAAALSGCNGYIQDWMDPGPPPVSQPEYVREAVPLAAPCCTGDDKEEWRREDGKAYIEMCSLAKGYVGAACKAPVQARFQVSKDGMEYAYYLPAGGEEEYFPLSMGSGTYTFQLYLHVQGESYERVMEVRRNVVLEDEHRPFLIPTALVEYEEESAAVQLGRELVKNCSTDLEVVQQVYYWVQKNLAYDPEKAERLQGQPLLGTPDLDDVLESGKGICIDFAVLTATMLRANGVPCKLVIGEADIPGTGTILHAWNMVWLEEDGAIHKDVAARAGVWTPIDLTLAASGGSRFKQLSEDTRYRPLSVH